MGRRLIRSGVRSGAPVLWGMLAVCLAALLCAWTGSLRAQDAEMSSAGRGGPFAGMPRVAGEVVSVTGATVTIKGEDGTYTIVTTDNTRIMKGRGNTVKVAELKPGDGVMAVGNLDAPTKTLHAAMLYATDAAQVRELRENLGKTYIAGRVVAVDLDNAKMTVERADHVKQTIGFDETTSFRRGRPGGRGAGGGFGGSGAGPGAAATPGATPASRPDRSASAGESITLADVKVGDFVTGQGALKAGVFTPAQLSVSTPGAGRAREGRPETGAAAPTPPPTR